MTPSIVRSPGAIALGCLFAAGTAATLFWDVRQIADVTPDHLMTGLVLIGTIASGHMFWHYLKTFKILSSVGLGTLFVAGTFYCVVTSAARNVETTVPKLLETLNINEQRAKLEGDIREAKDHLRKVTDAATRECATGAKTRCLGAQKTQEMADSHYWLLIGRLANMKPQQVDNAGLKHAAKVFAAVPFVAAGPDQIEHGLVLFSPFIKAMFLEAGTIIFLGVGLGGSSWVRLQFGSHSSSVPVQFAHYEPTNRAAKEKAVHDLIAYITLHGSVPSQDFLRERWGLRSKGTVSDWVSEWEQQGLIARHRNGKRNVLTARTE